MQASTEKHRKGHAQRIAIVLAAGHSRQNSLDSMRLLLPVLSPGRAEWNSQGVLTPGLLANQKSKPWRGDRDAGVLENVAICVPPSGVRFPAKTHHWGWHPRLLHATPPAFRSAPADVPFVGCVNVGHSREK